MGKKSEKTIIFNGDKFNRTEGAPYIITTAAELAQLATLGTVNK